MLTHERLRELLTYDPETGVFRWRKRQGLCRAGRIAGSVNTAGYRRIKVEERQYMAHRLAWFWMTGHWPENTIDHRDCNRRNNAWGNLREASRAQNLANSRTRKDSLSGVKGVRRMGRKWRADITVNSRTRYLGLFSSPEEANAAYKKAADQYYGEFARA